MVQKSVKQTIKTDSAYFLTLTVVNWVDIFSRKNHRDTIIESLNYCQQHKGLVVFAYVIMTNHIHLVVNANEPFLLKDVVRDFKKFTSKKIVDQIQKQPESRREWMLSIFASNAGNKHSGFRFWQEGNHAIELITEKFIWEKINYIHNNPVRAGFVKNPQDWLYSSAGNYCGLEKLLEVECIQQKLISVPVDCKSTQI
jgi:putative transposase